MAIDIKTENLELIGADELGRIFDSLLTSDTQMSTMLRKLIRKEFLFARRRISRDIAAALPHDPRKAAMAVKSSVYKQLFGANLSILAKRRASMSRVTLTRPRKLDQNPHQRGGNRRPQSDRTKQLESYYGADRGFILRFLNAGTDDRQTRYGRRGAISPRGLFAHVAPWHMDFAIEEIANEVVEYIKKQANG